MQHYAAKNIFRLDNHHTLHTFAFAAEMRRQPKSKVKESNRQRFIHFVESAVLDLEQHQKRQTKNKKTAPQKRGFCFLILLVGKNN